MTSKIRDMFTGGDLPEFADDMLILIDYMTDMTQPIQEQESLIEQWNLILNKAKSQVLTEDTLTDITGIPCVTPLKYF